MLMNKRTLLVIFLMTFLFASKRSYACDPCSLSSATKMMGQDSGKWSFSLSNQYTDFEKSDRYKDNSQKNGEIGESSSTSQLIAAYDFTDSLGVQINLPFVYQSFQQIEDFRSSNQHEDGLGDLSLGANYTPLDTDCGDYGFRLSLYGGLKFPTGDTGNLSEVESESPPHSLLSKHHPVSSGSGTVLSVGTGSYDFPISASLSITNGRAIFFSTAQYTFTTEGDFDYEFANNLLWDTGPGYYLSLDHDLTILTRVALAGEQKPTDKQNGQLVADSAVSNIYLGPQIVAILYDKLALEIGADFRVSKDNTDTVIADYRIRSGLGWRF